VTPGPAQALCALHPTVVATGTCARCGNYVCPACTGEGAFEICPTCRERLGIGSFPFTRESWNVGGLVSYSWERFTENNTWLLLCVVTLLLFGMVFATSFVVGIFRPLFEEDLTGIVLYSGVSQVVQTIASLAMQLALIRICLDVAVGRGVRIERLVRPLRRLPAALVQQLLLLVVVYVPIGAAIALPLLLIEDQDTAALVVVVAVIALMVPVVFISLGVAFMQYELVHASDAGIVSAIARSWQLAKGQRLPMFGVWVLSALIMMAGIAACCVGFIAAFPLANVILAVLYLTLRNGSGLPPPSRDD
jgi:hypothetical protein